MTIRKELASPEIIEVQFGKPWSEIARLVDAHTMTVQGWLSTRAPRVAEFESIGLTANSTGLNVSLFNLALGCHFPPETDDAAIAAEIEALKQFYTKRQVPWSWWLGPFPQPANIFDRLKQHGLVEAYQWPGLPAMAAPLPAKSPPLNPQINVWPASSRADLVAASHIRRIAFDFPEGAALTYFEDMAGDWLGGNPARLFLAKVGNGPPAAIGALIMGAGVPGIYIMATLPEWGRQGLGKAIMARMVSEATAEGHNILVLTAGDMGYGLYKKFGFEHIFNYKLFGSTSRGFPSSESASATQS